MGRNPLIMIRPQPPRELFAQPLFLLSPTIGSLRETDVVMLTAVPACVCVRTWTGSQKPLTLDEDKRFNRKETKYVKPFSLVLRSWFANL